MKQREVVVTGQLHDELRCICSEHVPIVQLHDFAAHQDFVHGFDTLIGVLERIFADGSKLLREKCLHGQQQRHGAESDDSRHSNLTNGIIALATV